MSSDSVIRVHDLGKAFAIYSSPRQRLLQAFSRRRLYKEFWALKHVSFATNRGETVGVIGRNGSGKSTLLQLICGTLTNTSGTVVTSGKIAALLELGTGFNPEFTGRENVHLACAIHGLNREVVNARMQSILDFAEIGEYVDRPVKTYSSGMFVRLAFSVIAHVDAEILIIDEALSVGDAYFNQKCMRFLRNFVDKKGTIFFVSHDSGAISALCDRVLWLENGRLAMDGRPKEVLEMYLASLYSQPPDSEHKPGQVEFQSSFGDGGARIQSVELQDPSGNFAACISGGERIKINIRCEVLKQVDQLLVGFLIKNKRGQNIFGMNTGGQYSSHSCKSGEIVSASFDFQMPILEAGEYVISAAVADGTQHTHIQHHWIHDALVFQPVQPPRVTD